MEETYQLDVVNFAWQIINLENEAKLLRVQVERLQEYRIKYNESVVRQLEYSRTVSNGMRQMAEAEALSRHKLEKARLILEKMISAAIKKRDEHTWLAKDYAENQPDVIDRYHPKEAEIFSAQVDVLTQAMEAVFGKAKEEE